MEICHNNDSIQQQQQQQINILSHKANDIDIFLHKY